ncbi:MAG: 3-hydroxyacyl-CoA dehydrogenase NAD-binding domain-containing protein [Paracoccaceae bacterium]
MIIGVVGLGTIGQRWAAAFSHAGHDVICQDPDPAQEAALRAALPGLIADLDGLNGPSPAPGRVDFVAGLAGLGPVDFVQENAPERLELKQALLPAIEDQVRDEVIIASSSSALLVSEMQRDCRLPGRIVLGHPFNPAHLMPLVEIVGGEGTAPETLRRARAFYEAMGKKPVTLNREVTGHLALRLMAAMWREAIAMARDGIASVADIDRAFIYGPGPKWTLQGAFISNALNADGIGPFLRRYGPTYQAIWDDLLDARLDEATIATVAGLTEAAVAGRSNDELRAAREAGLAEILAAVSRHGAL